MKTGEFYRHRFNHYVSKVTNVCKDYIELHTLNNSVKEIIKPEYFNMNYIPTVTIYHYENDINKLFKNCTIKCSGDTIRVIHNKSRLYLSINHNDLFNVQYSDDIKDVLGIDTNTLTFNISDVSDILTTLASLIKD